MNWAFVKKLAGWLKRKLPGFVRTSSSEDETLAHIFHSEIEWRRARSIYIRRHGLCAMCGAGKKLEVHHVVPYSKSEALRYDQTNLITLCRECHFRFGHGRNWHKSNPDIRNLCEKSKESLSHVV